MIPGIVASAASAFGSAAPAGPTPKWLDVRTTNITSNVTSHPIAMPYGVDAGDLLIVVLGMNSRDAVVPAPSGWTLIGGSGTNLSGTTCFYAFFKAADGAEGGTTVDFATPDTGRMTAHVHRIQAGTWSGAPEMTFVQTVSTTTPDCPSRTASWGAANTLWLMACAGNANASFSVYPGINGRSSYGGSIINLASCTAAIASESHDPGTFTASAGGVWQTATIAIKPAEAAFTYPETWDNVSKGTNVVLTDAGLSADVGSPGLQSVRSTSGKSSGKHYFEVLAGAGTVSGDGMYVGICGAAHTMTVGLGTGISAHGYRTNGTRQHAGNIFSDQTTWQAGDVLMIAIDVGAGLLWFGKNGTWNNSGNPAAGTGASFISVSYSPIYAAASPAIVGHKLRGRFKAADFSYSPPAGFLAWQAP